MIICEVNKNHLNVRTRELLTAGSQNVNTVEFRFNAAWDGLVKTATFKTSKKTISVLLNTNTTAIPWEALADAGEILAVGVFGVSGETLVLPTVWGILGKVMDAAHLGDEEKEPTPDVYQKILDELNALERPTWDAVQNKPFSTLGGGLEVDENGVLSAQGGGGGSDNAVQYVAQELTDEQQAQARENIGAIGSPQSATVGDVLTVEEVDENSKPTKWKTAPAAANAVQADWYEQDSTKPSYIKNGFAKLEFTEKDAPSSGLTTKDSYQYLVSIPSGKVRSYVCYQLSVLSAPDTYDTIYVDTVPTNELATLNNIKVAIEEFGKRYNITNVSILNNATSGVRYWTPKDNPVRVYICGVKANSEIDVKFLPPPDLETDYAGIFKASPVNNSEELNNLKPVKYYNSYTNPDATTSDKFPSLYAQKEIKIFDTFDFNTIVLGQGSGDKFSLCYTSNIGNACTELGITEDDLPIMSYLTDYSVGSPPSGTYYIETATNKRFIAKYRYGTTTWSYIKKISGASSAFYINITSTTDDSGNTTYSADKTADEIVAAYDSGALMVAVMDKGNGILRLSYYNRQNYTNRSYHILSFGRMINGVNTDLMITATIYTSGDKTNDVSIRYNSDSLHAYLAVWTDDDGNRKIFEQNVDTLNAAINGGYISIIDMDIDRVYAVNEVIYDDTDVKLIAVDHVDNKLIKITGNLNSSGDEENQYTYSEEDLPQGSSYTLPVATADALGGVKADAATAEDTQDVHVNADGKLVTKAGGGSEREWSQLASIDLAEIAGASILLSGLDNYTEFYCESSNVKNASTLASWFVLKINGTNVAEGVVSIAKQSETDPKYQYFIAKYNGLIWQVRQSNGTTSNTNVALTYQNSSAPYNAVRGVGKATKIELAPPISAYVATQGTIKIWGR